MKQKSLAITILALLNTSVVYANPQQMANKPQTIIAQTGQPAAPQGQIPTQGQVPMQQQPAPAMPQSQMPPQVMPQQSAPDQAVQSTDADGHKQTVIVDQNGNLKVMEGAQEAQSQGATTPGMSASQAGSTPNVSPAPNSPQPPIPGMNPPPGAMQPPVPGQSTMPTPPTQLPVTPQPQSAPTPAPTGGYGVPNSTP